ncbi:RDD family protein [Nocardioides sediminis]|uniref:RDD family protein n=1 Tax=Nocardioides sediminis TaxID=433648 RepID=UPI000D301B7B|nr:RDD family protein [Nocardioides sediminis]
MTQQQTEAPATTYPIAGLERRFYAFATDRLLTWGVYVLVGVGSWLVLGDRPWAVVGIVAGAMVLGWLVLAVMTGVSGSTPGKSAVGLRVVHHGTGTPIGVGPALVRSLVVAAASLPTFGIGLATLAWTAVEDRGRQRRGWHDHLASSVVVDVRPVEVVAESVDESPRHVVNLTAMRLVPAPAVETPVFQAPPPMTRPAPESRPAPTHAPAPTPAPAPAPAARRAHPAPGGTAEAPATPRPATPQLPATPAVAHHQQQPPSAPAPQQPVIHRPPVDDPGRTVVRPRPGAAAGPGPSTHTGPRWRVRFDDGQTFVVEGMVLVGRRPEPRAGEAVWHLVPLTSADMSVSKTHAQFAPAPDGALVVMDRGSTNGSTLTRQGVARQLSPGKPATLVDGDTVTFGDRSMEVRREA